MNTYGVEVGQVRCPSDGGTACITIKSILSNGNAVIQRNKDKAKTEMDCFKISYRYCFIIEPDSENIGDLSGN